MPATDTSRPARRWSPSSLALLTTFWAILQLSGLTRPGLLDDVDSIYIEIAREMLLRRDFVTPYIDGIRFFDKPPLMYWLAAASMRLFGAHDWAARLPLALAFLALLFATYALALRLFSPAAPLTPEIDASKEEGVILSEAKDPDGPGPAHTPRSFQPQPLNPIPLRAPFIAQPHRAMSGTATPPDRPALYSALALATALGPYLYTRFFIPDILIALWMTLSVHLFLILLDRAATSTQGRRTTLLSGLFGLTLALNLLTKGLIGLIFPLAFALLYILLTRQAPLLRRTAPGVALFTFLAAALPWHIFAALRNPAIPIPPGLGLPSKAGWVWFYLYNEHLARALGRRIPHDYGNTPVPLFWFYAALWLFPWTAFLFPAIRLLRRWLGHLYPVTRQQREAALTCTLWALLVLVFFSISGRQEYYSIPAFPALALMAGGLLARAERTLPTPFAGPTPLPEEARWALTAHRWILLPLGTLTALLCGYLALTAHHPAPVSGASPDLYTTLNSNPANYNLSLGHLFDLTGAAMGFFRGPLLSTALGMAILGPAAYLLRRRNLLFSANLTVAAGMTLVLLAAHEGLVRFNPILGSKPLAQAILTEQRLHSRPNDLILIDGELTSGSTLLFYTRQPVHLVNGRVNGPWFGSLWHDSPPIFETDTTLHTLWHGPNRLFLLTPDPTARTRDLAPFGPVRSLASAGGKTILTNR